MTVALVAAVAGTLLLPTWRSEPHTLYLRVLCVSFFALLVFSLLEKHPASLPAWLARWALQIFGVAVSIPMAALLLYVLGTEPGQPNFWEDPQRLAGFVLLCVTGILFAPWIALTALVRQKDAIARHQALTFDLERSELSRRALDARLRLLQAQVEPHFLFNTLANVRALVDAGSPQASSVLGSLITYLRGAIPRLQSHAATVQDEVALARAYLELMHMRMPDRLDYAISVDYACNPLSCPPTTLLTLVENAIRHGIDPSENGGRIDVVVKRQGERCTISVRDTGLGLSPQGDGAGTGLESLRERLRLTFAGDASLEVASAPPTGVVAIVDMPAIKDSLP